MEVTCRWCGLTADETEFDADHVNSGFWCPDCDGYTFRDADENDRQRIVLMLESDTAADTEPSHSVKQLNKRLSPLRYPGGKARIAELIAENLDAEHVGTFVECFAGGAAVGLALLDAGMVDRLVLNDTDEGVYAFWSELIEHPDSLIRHLEHPADRSKYFTAKTVLEDAARYPQADVAWAELLCNRLSFSGVTTGGMLGGKDGSDEALFSRYTPKTLIRRIERIGRMADRITVSCKDAAELIADQAFWTKNATLFVDPPYVGAGKRLYRKYYKDVDHRELAWLLQLLNREFPSTKIIITYDDCELIRSLYPDAKVLPVGRRYTLKHGLRCG